MDITMPQLGETVTEGTITKWVKQVGDTVALDETLFEVSTDKVDSEVPSPVAGILTEIVVNEGDTAEVGTKLAVISDSEEAPAASGTSDTSSLAVSEPTAPANARSEVSQPPIPAYAPSADAAAPAPAQAPAPTAGGSGTKGKLISPLVRKMINDNGLNADTIVGTGAGGRITRDDVQALLNGQTAAPAVPSLAVSEPTAPANARSETTGADPIAAAAPAPAPAPQVARPSTGDTVIPFDNMRRRTAEHMVMSKHTSPHAYISTEVDFENVERVRKTYGPSFKEREGFSLTYLPFIVRALSEVIHEFPNVNATVDGDNLVIHNDFHVGIAVDLNDQGLVVPALRNADGKRLRLIAQEIRDIAVRARNKQLKPDEIMGSTLTITNPGPYGSYQTFPIINQPQVAILATDGVNKKPVVVQDEFGQDVIAIHHMGMLTLGWDHRAFDGGYTAKFLSRLKEVLETRDWEAEIV